jgi:hypothetical protein
LTTDLARIARERPIPLKADEMNDLRQCIEDLRIGLESSATSSPARDREVDEYVAHVLQTC